LCYKDMVMQFDVDSWTTAPSIKQHLTDIREGRVEDTHGWMQPV
jgi:branched-chain amino acid aminotransferase